MRDLRRSDVNILTLGQYLRPSDGHLPIVRYYTPDEFAELREIGLQHGLRARPGEPADALVLPRLGAGRAGDRKPGGRRSRVKTTESKPRKSASTPVATAAPGPDADTQRSWLRQMLLIRRFEEKAGEAYSLGKIGGFCHLYIGQEAVAVGSIAALRADDYITCVLSRARARAGARHERRAP